MFLFNDLNRVASSLGLGSKGWIFFSLSEWHRCYNHKSCDFTMQVKSISETKRKLISC